MAEKLLMLALSPTMEHGTIIRWLKREGDTVAAGEVICEVETDKATMEYESTADGALLRILVPQGGEARVGDPIAVVGRPGEVIESLPAESPQPAATPAPAATDASAGSLAPVGVATPSVTAPTPPASDGRVKASPLARKLAADSGLDLRVVNGTGPGGRIIKRDVEQALAGGGAAVPPAAPPPVADQTVPVTQKRRVIARRLAESKFSAPHYYLKLSVDMALILEAREALRHPDGNKLSLNTFLMRFAAEALRRHPMVNATWGENAITLHPRADIGLAVAQPDGLITPVVRDCGGKGLLAIDLELQELVGRARAGRLTPEEYTGATFSISNLGAFGIEEFTAIINPPGSAILAVGEIRRQPVAGPGDALVVRPLMKLTLSCDHRVVDGAVGAAFLKELKGLMENPIRLMV
ncbi:MAG TPA: dihydrolipoamide acetyltransferase family protein [Acidobacteriota bacterium]|nr:dihydrolipoamide acetyltransferase family protein [Acidobacteriota bacterium]HQG91371.1 dihydrolipoamide acetyltransferase family protein [Acidobacteriota bacterium]